MSAVIVAGGVTQRTERIVSTRINLLVMLEEHIIRTHSLSSHVIFNLLQEIKDDLDPQLGVTQYQLHLNLANLHFLASGSFFFF